MIADIYAQTANESVAKREKTFVTEKLQNDRKFISFFLTQELFHIAEYDGLNDNF